MRQHFYSVYIATNKYNNVLYTGVTNNLLRRIYEHKEGLVEGFTSQYKITKLVYYEIYENINDAIKREKQIKGWKRYKKINLIKNKNPLFKDLYKELI